MALNINIDNEIDSFEVLKFQVSLIEKYLRNLEGFELHRSCELLENNFRPYFEKNKQRCDNSTTLEINESCIGRNDNTSESQISNFDSEHTFTDKFLNSVQDESLLQDPLLMQNNILDYNPDSKNYCFEKSEEELKYDVNFKDNSANYLDLSHKSGQDNDPLDIQQNKIDGNIPSNSRGKILSNSSEIILNLCSRNKNSNLGEHLGKHTHHNPDNMKEEFDSLPYINPSTILLEERILDRNDDINSNIHLNSFTNTQQPMKENNVNSIFAEKSQDNIRDDITRIFSPNFNSDITAIQNSSTLKDDVKKLFHINPEYSPYVSDVDATLLPINEVAKSSLIHTKTEHSNSLIAIDCDSDVILNLKKEPICKENIPSVKENHQENLSCYKVLEPICTTNKTSPQKIENNIKALNLVSKRSKSSNFTENCDIIMRDTSTIPEMEVMEALGEVTDVNLESIPKDDYSPVSCLKCRNEYNNLLLWTEHKNKGICMAPQYCIHCDIQFNSKYLYQKHVLCHKRNTCTKCSSSFRRRQLLRIHMKTEHGIKLVSKTYTCEHCKRVFMKRSSIYHHLQKHALPHQKVCTKCGKFLDSEEAYEDHLNEHVKNSFLRCHLCSAIFSRFQQYSDHMKGHKKHICSYCEGNQTSFSNKKQLFRHYKTEHPDLPQNVVLDKKYNCDLCPKMFSRPSLLRNHRMTHSNNHQWECHQCNKKYAQRNGLRKHMISFHNESIENKIICQYCGFIFPSQTHVNKHIVKVHNIPVSCTYCDYKTKKLKPYKRHLNRHKGKKKYLCDICGSMFQCSFTLRDHNLFLHSNERKFQCKECDKTFKNQSCLSRHKRTHSNERPYKCDCGMCYKQLSHLSRHLSSVHNKKLPSIKKKIVNSEEVGISTALSSENNVSTSNSILVSEIDKTNEILLTSGNSLIMPEGSLSQEPLPLFTVLDSQLIHLIPSTVQLHQEGVHTVSFVNNGDFHALSIAPPYQISQVEPFNENSSTDAIIIHSAQTEAANSFTLHSLPTGNSNNSSNVSSENKMENELGSLSSKESSNTGNATNITLETGPDIQFTSGSLTDLHYRENDENDSISSLTSSHYLTHQDETLSQDMGSSNISIECSPDFYCS